MVSLMYIFVPGEKFSSSPPLPEPQSGCMTMSAARFHDGGLSVHIR